MTTRAAGLGQAGARVRQRLVAVVGDDDALARGEPVVLDDVRRAEGVERVGDLVQRCVHTRASAVGHVGRGHDLLGERLAALEPGGRR